MRSSRREGEEELVWSSERGRATPSRAAGPPPEPAGDGIVRVGRTSSGRRGKTVTLVTGVPPQERDTLARELRRRCGAGGAVKDGTIEIQGDHRDAVVAALQGRYRVKRAGG